MRKSLFSARKNEMKNARKHNGGSKAWQGGGDEKYFIYVQDSTFTMRASQLSRPLLRGF